MENSKLLESMSNAVTNPNKLNDYCIFCMFLFLNHVKKFNDFLCFVIF